MLDILVKIDDFLIQQYVIQKEGHMSYHVVCNFIGVVLF